VPGPHFCQPASPRGLLEPRCGESRKSGSEGAQAPQCAGATRLIIGAAAGSAIATLVERTSRYVMLAYLGRERSADAVRDSLINTVHQLPEALRGTLTWDQGAEMSEHRAFTIATDMQVYFCEPGSPWQRGTNENTNGLLRQYFPRGTDCPSTPPTSCKPSRTNSTPDPGNHSPGTPQLNDLLLY
jgi:transposase InsO family protein